MAEIEVKVFHHFLEFSPKVRMMVIDEMDPADRCRLTRCSKLCNEEAKASKNYIYELSLDYILNGAMRIDVIHGKYRPNTGYVLLFKSEEKLRKYMNERCEPLWEIEVDSRLDVSHLALEEFKRIIQKYQRNIRKIRICIYSPEESTEKIELVDFGIESLDSLEHLFVRGEVDVQNLYSKLQKPLKKLNIHGYENSDIIDYEPIYQVQEELTWLEPKFDNQKFLQLSAKSVAISIGKLTERDIFNFIRSWQNGTIGKEIEHYAWSLHNSTFNIHQFLKFLRISDYGRQREIMEIKHFKDDGKYADLFISELYIHFVIPQTRR